MERSPDFQMIWRIALRINGIDAKPKTRTGKTANLGDGVLNELFESVV